MSKHATPIGESKIVLNQNESAPLYRQLYERLKNRILTGQLEAGTRLPSTRMLASELGVSRNTTALAYELLLLEGYIESRVGDGTRVACLQPQRPQEPVHPQNKHRRKEGKAPSAPFTGRGQLYSELAHLSSPRSNPENVSIFSVGQPDVTLFPYKTWGKLIAKHARYSLPKIALYHDAQGYAPLREAIASHIGITRGVQCSPEQIIMTSGAQGAFDLLARVLLKPGDPVWVEDPGYNGSRGALLAASTQIVPVPVDREGLVVDAGRQLRPDARMALVTPSHQFPTGVPMSLNRRLELLRWAREAEAWIAEDDYDSEYRFSGRPLEALQNLDSSRVIYIGTFSKVLLPALRLGYLIAPPELLENLLVARYFVDVHPPMLEQMALTDFITEGNFARHLRRMRQLYLERRNALIDALTRELSDLLDIVTPEAGIHLVAWLPERLSAQVGACLEAHGLTIRLTSQYNIQPQGREGLMLGFATATPEDLRTGVHMLTRALRSL
ncbi:PLP-dependent aminotransferase family protein [Ktedonospora formicarum]|uniref:GntR family transcriptional regulator n=1 Tax=Ktedonospora formicarum TaxID=2778364 RepID=A0A8J3HXU4_9CHLR|nr:PLP-dependent aminotransferase family protein [Ktedonospora formicarum]GHO46172.1 GntR family transcriptional regulator [Ktedonospora formicarum]